ncbi:MULTISPECIES: barstar family protein [unclassified Streptomyces]|uniref:barstar family protein n=1 Tax=unclassified Streptomyces TaxID=2593676 RepID=UPI00378B49BE
MSFPDYYGQNLDALNDCLRDVESYEYGTTRDATGLVIVFTSYGRFARAEPRTAQIVLDILADRARSAALFGHRIMCLVHSNDPDISFEPVGAMPVQWNDAERLDSSRRSA